MAHLKELSYEHGGASVGGPPGKDIEEYGDELEEAARWWLENQGLVVETGESEDTVRIIRADQGTDWAGLLNQMSINCIILDIWMAVRICV